MTALDFNIFLKKWKKLIGNKNIMTSIYWIQAYDSMMCGYFCIWFIDFIIKGKSLLDFTNLFSPNDYEKNDNIKLKYFQDLKRWKNHIVLFAVSISKS